MAIAKHLGMFEHGTRRLGDWSSGNSRRQWLRMASTGLAGFAAAPWFQALADVAAVDPRRRRSCILLWMSGGPSQLDTFDMKPGHRNGGPFKPISTATPGLQVSERLPKIAAWSEHMAVVRSMTSKEGDHGRATQLVRSGYAPSGPVRYPTFGSLVAKELGSGAADIPNFVSISPNRVVSPGAYGPGFLGSQYAPLIVGDYRPDGNESDQGATALEVENVTAAPGIGDQALARRVNLLSQFNHGFAKSRLVASVESHSQAYERAMRMMRSDAAKAFDLTDEPAAIRDAYGRNRFGQGCLLARRLVERGVPFVEVTHGGDTGGIAWDTHVDNFGALRKLCDVLDNSWATLMRDLQDRGLLESTLIVWMGEFGRTPVINEQSGRDHFPQAWCSVLSGGGIRGGQAIGRTDASGMAIEERPVSVPDLLATICKVIGIDPAKQNMSNAARPIRIVDPAAVAVEEIVA